MDDEIARLRQALEEQQRQQRQREEELQRQQRQREEELQRRYEEERRQREELQRRYEEAEEKTRPLQLQTYLEACHELSLAIQVVTDPTLTTRGDTTNPARRIFPRRIIPWDDFPTKQEGIWHKFTDSSFAAKHIFPNRNQMDYVRSVLQPISSEYGLRYYERQAVEDVVKKLVDAVYEDSTLREKLGLRGTVTFESHLNLSQMESMMSELSERTPSTGETARTPSAAARKRLRLTKGIGGQPDQFCVYRTSDAADVPTLAIEYKAPHKLSTEELVTGLESEIQPERDVINKEGSDFAFAAKTLAAAVVTQLFSYMVAKGIRYGYVCTGQAFVFLHVPEDPTIVYYHLCVPNQDVLDDDENRLHRTAVAQVFAFILQALHAPPPPLSWFDTARENLSVWAVEYDDILRKIPPTVRKEKVGASPYKPGRWRGFTRSPIRTRSYCAQIDAGLGSRHKDDDGDEEGTPPSPSVGRQTRSRGKAATSGTSSSGSRGQRDRGGTSKGGPTRQRMQDCSYCTQRCLRGVVSGGPIDRACPNAAEHGPKHISQEDFRHLLRAQLARDRGPEPDCIPLSLSGAIGLLFKVRLSAYGYTFVAKGVETENLWRLQNEKGIYDQIGHIQGRHVPVCLGLIDLALPYYFDGHEFDHFLLLSWAGQPLYKCLDKIDKTLAMDLTTEAFTKLHQQKVLHGDAELRNLLYDASSGKVMVVDFERATLRQPLGSISPNSPHRKRKRGLVAKKQESNEFEKELQSAVEGVSLYFGKHQPSGQKPRVG
ncbi:hypothetical protein VTH06DRAFT_7690 [Thermothelomyces fergusii]